MNRFGMTYRDPGLRQALPHPQFGAGPAGSPGPPHDDQ
jgi:hypothetical protein